MSSREGKETYTLDLTWEAQDDLRDIIQYTLETWGEAQALAYREKMVTGLEALRRNPRIGRLREDILPNYRIYSVGEHIVIYWLTSGAVIVTRILHGRMDPNRHLHTRPY